MGFSLIYGVAKKISRFYVEFLMSNILLIIVLPLIGLVFLGVHQGLTAENSSTRLNCDSERTSVINSRECFREKRELYQRTRDLKDLNNALNHAEEASKQYQQIIQKNKPNITYIQAKLNQLSLSLEVNEWLELVTRELQKESWVPTIVGEQRDVATKQKTWLSHLQKISNDSLTIENKIQELADSSRNSEIIYAQINYAKSLLRMQDSPLSWGLNKSC
jgi:chromosome segregation ATPase